MGNSLPKPILEKRRLSGELPAIKCQWAVSSMQGWSKVWEDKFSVLEKLESDKHVFDGYTYFGVFDGHAGSKAAKAAAELLPKEIIKCAEQHVTDQVELSNEEMEKCLIKSFLNFDNYLFDNRKELLKKDTEFNDEGREVEIQGRREGDDGELQYDVESSGTAAVCALVSDKHVFIANCGDSRAIIVDGDKPIISTKDHKPTLPEERERIAAAHGLVINGRVDGVLALSRAFGDFDFKIEPDLPFEKQHVSPEPDITFHKLSGQEQFIILASDGVWDSLSSEDLVAYIRYVIQMKQEYTIQDICDIVLDICLTRGPSDDSTIIILAFPDRLPTYDEDLVRRDAQLDIVLQQKADEILTNPARNSRIQCLSDLMWALKEMEIPDLPPGAGLSAKRKLLDVKYQEHVEREKQRREREAIEEAAREAEREAARQAEREAREAERLRLRSNGGEDRFRNAGASFDQDDNGRDPFAQTQIFKLPDSANQ